MSDDNNFNIEESAALLRTIYPSYPDIRGMKPVPEIGAFLQTLHAGDSSHRETSESETFCHTG